jgi:hypothetical protein
MIPNRVSINIGNDSRFHCTPMSKSTSGRPVPSTENSKIALVNVIVAARSTVMLTRSLICHEPRRLPSFC